MKKCRNFFAVILIFCLVLTTSFSTLFSDTASAKEITTAAQAKKLAKKTVKGAHVIEVERDDEDGIPVYEIELVKGKKEYNLVYRVSDSKLISYNWSIQSGYVKKGKGHIISRKKCKKLAKKKVSGGKIISVLRKRDDGIDYYKIKMRKGKKHYELEIHARSGKLLEYEWELVAKGPSVSVKSKPNSSRQNSNQPKATTKPQASVKPDTIGWQQPTAVSLEEAKQIALNDADLSAGDVVFTKAERDDFVWYDIEFYSTTHEYEYEINASTGAINKKEVEKRDTIWENPAGNTGNQDVFIEEERAKQIALDEVSGATFVKLEFDLDNGIPMYEVELLLGEFEYEVKVHAVNGTVLKVEKESVYD